jgi:hypothetical protein
VRARLLRRLLAEFTGTALLVAVVVGSGIAAARLTPDGGLRLLINSIVTALGLAVLILIFAPAAPSTRPGRSEPGSGRRTGSPPPPPSPTPPSQSAAP